MTKPIATLESVWAAADALAAEGIEPSLELIRKRLGGGSHTTIAPHLKTWTARRDELAALDVPEDLVARGSTFVRELFLSALRSAQQTAEAPLLRAKAELDSAKAHLADAEAEVARLEREVQRQAEELVRQAKTSRAVELNLAAQQAMTQEKALAVTRLEGQLEEARRALAEKEQEAADLRASNRAAEGLEARLETLQRSVQGLASANSK